MTDRRGSGDGPFDGWPSSEFSPMTPAGEQEQLGQLASGLSRQRGWRLIAARGAAVVFLLAIAAVVLADLIYVLA